MTVDVDPEAWAEEYGLDPSDKTAIRQDVQNYCVNGVASITASMAWPSIVPLLEWRTS
jgi:hypothetical protein